MPDVKQLFRAATEHAQPAPGALARQLQAQRRRARNRKLSALAVAAVIVAAIALFAASAINRGKEGSAPAIPPGGSAPAFSIVELDGTIRSSIRTLPEGAMTPSISPDGTTIVFVVGDPSGTKLRIATMQLDGSGFRFLTDASIAAWMPHWSPDGREIVFYRVDGEKLYQLMVMDADGTHVREVLGTQLPDDNPPNLSPDGSLILYTSLISNGQQDVATIPATGGLSTALAAELDVREEVGAWSPDGRSIAFRRLDSPDLNTMEATSGPNYEIWVMNADGSHQHLVAAIPGANASSPEWSPDGSKIAFIGARKWSDTVYVVDVATGDITEIVGGLPAGQGNWLPGRATWMPDGDAVLVTTYAP